MHYPGAEQMGPEGQQMDMHEDPMAPDRERKEIIGKSIIIE